MKNIWMQPQTYNLKENYIELLGESCAQDRTGTELNPAHTKMLALSGHYVLANY